MLTLPSTQKPKQEKDWVALSKEIDALGTKNTKPESSGNLVTDFVKAPVRGIARLPDVVGSGIESAASGYGKIADLALNNENAGQGGAVEQALVSGVGKVRDVTTRPFADAVDKALPYSQGTQAAQEQLNREIADIQSQKDRGVIDRGLESFGAALSNPRGSLPSVLESVPQFLAGSAALKSAGVAAGLENAGGLAGKIGQSGAIVGIGNAALEGEGAERGARQEMQSLSDDKLRENPQFRELEAKYGTEEARRIATEQVGINAYGTAALTGAGAAALTGGGLEGALLRRAEGVAPRVAGGVVKETLKGAGKEGLEELSQGYTGQVAQNLAMQPYTGVAWDEGAAEQAGMGAGMGFLSGGVGGASGATYDKFKPATPTPTDTQANQTANPSVQPEATPPDGTLARATWQPPSYNINPDADAIVKNRTVQGQDLQQAIDERFANTEKYNPLSGAWEQPTANIIPDAEQIVKNNTVNGKGVQQTIDDQYQNKDKYNPFSKAWEKPQYQDTKFTKAKQTIDELNTKIEAEQPLTAGDAEKVISAANDMGIDTKNKPIDVVHNELNNAVNEAKINQSQQPTQQNTDNATNDSPTISPQPTPQGTNTDTPATSSTGTQEAAQAKQSGVASSEVSNAENELAEQKPKRLSNNQLNELLQRSPYLQKDEQGNNFINLKQAVDDAVNSFSHLIEPSGTKFSEKQNVKSLADSIEKNYDLSNPQVNFSYSLLRAIEDNSEFNSFNIPAPERKKVNPRQGKQDVNVQPEITPETQPEAQSSPSVSPTATQEQQPINKDKISRVDYLTEMASKSPNKEDFFNKVRFSVTGEYKDELPEIQKMLGLSEPPKTWAELEQASNRFYDSQKQARKQRREDNKKAVNESKQRQKDGFLNNLEAQALSSNQRMIDSAKEQDDFYAETGTNPSIPISMVADKFNEWKAKKAQPTTQTQPNDQSQNETTQEADAQEVKDVFSRSNRDNENESTKTALVANENATGRKIQQEVQNTNLPTFENHPNIQSLNFDAKTLKNAQEAIEAISKVALDRRQAKLEEEAFLSDLEYLATLPENKDRISVSQENGNTIYTVYDDSGKAISTFTRKKDQIELNFARRKARDTLRNELVAIGGGTWDVESLELVVQPLDVTAVNAMREEVKGRVRDTKDIAEKLNIARQAHSRVNHFDKVFKKLKAIFLAMFNRLKPENKRAMMNDDKRSYKWRNNDNTVMFTVRKGRGKFKPSPDADIKGNTPQERAKNLARKQAILDRIAKIEANQLKRGEIETKGAYTNAKGADNKAVRVAIGDNPVLLALFEQQLQGNKPEFDGFEASQISWQIPMVSGQSNPDLSIYRDLRERNRQMAAWANVAREEKQEEETDTPQQPETSTKNGEVSAEVETELEQSTQEEPNPKPLQDLIRAQDLPKVLDHIIKSKSSFSGIARTLKNKLPANLKFEVVPELKAEKTKELPIEQQRDIPANFSKNDGNGNPIIRINEKYLSSKDLDLMQFILHELAHAETVFALETDKLFRAQLNNIIKAIAAHAEKTNGVLTAKDTNGKTYEMFRVSRLFKDAENTEPNAEELVAYGLTDPRFQIALQEIPYDDNISVWDKFVDAVARVLGVQVKGKNADKTALATVLRLSMELVEEQAKAVTDQSTTTETQSVRNDAPFDENTSIDELQQIYQNALTRSYQDKVLKEINQRLYGKNDANTENKQSDVSKVMPYIFDAIEKPNNVVNGFEFKNAKFVDNEYLEKAVEKANKKLKTNVTVSDILTNGIMETIDGFSISRTNYHNSVKLKNGKVLNIRILDTRGSTGQSTATEEQNADKAQSNTSEIPNSSEQSNQPTAEENAQSEYEAEQDKATGQITLKNGVKIAARTLYYPNLSVSKLNKLLSKVKLNSDDIEDLKDYKYLLLFDEQSAIEKGFMQGYNADGGVIYKPKNNFWLLNINDKIKENGGDPYNLTNNPLALADYSELQQQQENIITLNGKEIPVADVFRQLNTPRQSSKMREDLKNNLDEDTVNRIMAIHNGIKSDAKTGGYKPMLQALIELNPNPKEPTVFIMKC